MIDSKCRQCVLCKRVPAKWRPSSQNSQSMGSLWWICMQNFSMMEKHSLQLQSIFTSLNKKLMQWDSALRFQRQSKCFAMQIANIESDCSESPKLLNLHRGRWYQRIRKLSKIWIHVRCSSEMFTYRNVIWIHSVVPVDSISRRQYDLNSPLPFFFQFPKW